MKNYRFGILYAVFLIAWTIYVLLDTFVIARVYQPAERENAESKGASSVLTVVPASPVWTEHSYTDQNLSITITEHRAHDTTLYVAEIKLNTPELLKAALAQDTYGRNITQKTSEMAKQAGAILAINGDYYGSREKGYVLRNGTLYRSRAAADQEDLVIYRDGSWEIIRESEVSAEALLEKGAQQIFSFGPALIVNGEIAVSAEEEVGKAMSSNPRTAIGIVDSGHYYFVVSDGRTSESEGLSLRELSAFMQKLNVTTAYNLDGGGSSTLVFRDEVINIPTTNGKRIKERSVSDIVYIGY